MDAINRKQLVSRHNPVLETINTSSPLTVGNGRFAFTADVTGFQSLASHYEACGFPLCTMSEWGWHTEPFPDRVDGRPSAGELRLTEYPTPRGTFRYAVKKFPGNESVYDWLRKNPHRLNLCRIALTLGGLPVSPTDITSVRQELHLYDGLLVSEFMLRGSCLRVETACGSETDTLVFIISTAAFGQYMKHSLPPGLAVELSFPYGSPGISGAEWSQPGRHVTELKTSQDGCARILRRLDSDRYTVGVSSSSGTVVTQRAPHSVLITPASRSDCFTVSIGFVDAVTEDATLIPAPFAVREQSLSYWHGFWEEGGAIDLSGTDDVRAAELERRIVLSQYLLAIQSSGSIPPAETGLTCNSWYGKFHLEMYPLHAAWLPLWGHTGLLERSLFWFSDHLEDAKQNARKNGYKGARWPKMVGPDAQDSPSMIATLLVWQQPHIIYLLELARRSGAGIDFPGRYRDVVFETAEFMVDFAVFDSRRGTWNLESPLIPVQEEHEPEGVRNPGFEVAYWRYALRIAVAWFMHIGEAPPEMWERVAEGMAPMPVADGLYIAHEGCPDTFTAFNRDHPSMLMSLGFIPGDRIDFPVMRRTLDRTVACWDYDSLWGWDFAVMALTAARLGDPELAVDLLLTDTPKNTYEVSGNNRQAARADLPLYLPGNGGVLLAAAQLAADGTFSRLGWKIKSENIRALPE